MHALHVRNKYVVNSNFAYVLFLYNLCDSFFFICLVSSFYFILLSLHLFLDNRRARRKRIRKGAGD